MLGKLLLGALVASALVDTGEKSHYCRNCGSDNSRTSPASGGRTKYTCRNCGRWWYK